MNPLFNSLEFDGINSLDNDIYITAKDVYNAPERDVDVVEIPGRSGDYIIDNGRWKNIDVTYTAGTFGDDQAQFANKIMRFRNLLHSRVGYKRLVDTYNTDEYRLAVLKDQTEVEPVQNNQAGEFELVFNCTPYRYLMSGEAEQLITSGDTLFNPTLIESQPLLLVDGYGDISFNGYNIAVENDVFGDIELASAQTDEKSTSRSQFSYDHLSSGDSIYVKGYQGTIKIKPRSTTAYLRSVTVGTRSPFNLPVSIGNKTRVSDQEIDVQIFTYEDITGFTASRGAEELSAGLTISATFETSGGSTVTDTYTATISLGKTTVPQSNVYDIMQLRSTVVASSANNLIVSAKLQLGEVRGVSTKSVLGTPTYIDCDLGQAYLIENGEIVSLNRYITFGSDLPVLAPGENEITYSGNITSLKIVPRWRML